MSAHYVTLLSALPHLPKPAPGARLPISRYRLGRRLSMLAADERALIEELVAVCAHDPKRLPLQRDDAAFQTRVARLLARLSERDVHAAAVFLLSLRTAVAALRLRARRSGPLGMRSVPGYAPVKRLMIAHQSQRHFGLQAALPAIRPLAEAFDSGDPRAVEQCLIEVSWAELDRLGQRHRFDATALALYVLRFDLLARAVTLFAPAQGASQRQAVRARFDAMRSSLCTQPLASGTSPGARL